MNPDRFQPVRIGVPNWAMEPDISLFEVTTTEYESIQKHREKILEMVHTEVTGYLNTEDLVYDEKDDEDDFPNLSKMTGEYYISDESYEKHVDPIWFEIGIQTHFLEKQWMEEQSDFDYLGLFVWIKCDPKSWTFEISGNTDSSSL